MQKQNLYFIHNYYRHMKKTIILTITLFALLWTQLASANLQLPTYTHINTSKTYNDNVTTDSFFEIDWDLVVRWNLVLWTSAQISGNLTVYGDLKTWSYSMIDWNVTVTWDVDLWTFAEIWWTLSWKEIETDSSITIDRIIAQWDLDLGTYSVINKWINVSWNLKTWSFIELKWYSKVLGNIDLGPSSSIEGVLYAYKKLKTWSYIQFKKDKIKVVSDFKLWTFWELYGRVYVYWKKEYGSVYDEELKNYTWFFWQIDPLLIYNFSKSKITQIKDQTNSYLQKIAIIDNEITSLSNNYNANRSKITQKKTEKYITYKALFSYLQPLIENESFDQNTFATIKRSYIWNAPIATVNTQSNSNINTTTHTASKYSPFLPQELENRLDQVISRIPESQKVATLKNVNVKISTFVNSLSKQKQTRATVRKINLLLWIKEYINKSLSEINSDKDILRELWL